MPTNALLLSNLELMDAKAFGKLREECKPHPDFCYIAKLNTLNIILFVLAILFEPA